MFVYGNMHQESRGEDIREAVKNQVVDRFETHMSRPSLDQVKENKVENYKYATNWNFT